MTIISLLLVLLVERITTLSRYWQAEFYTEKYIAGIESRKLLNSSSSSWLVLLVIFVPVVLTYLLVQKFSGGLLELIISTAILMICIGCPSVRATYKCFLQAANRDDLQACSLHEEQIKGEDKASYSFGLNLVWQNYRHYSAIVLWFAVCGAAGAILYVLVRDLDSRLSTSNQKVADQVKRLLYIIDWIPVRITALGMLVVGHFSRAFPTWLGYLPDSAVEPKKLLLDVSKQAEDIEPDEDDCTEEPRTLVRLAKRNVMFLLVIIALLTMAGWVA